jgi:bifunctional DNase/RNase
MLIEMSIKGLMVDPMAGTPIVILKDKQGERVLPIWVGVPEANAIALQIENVSTPRPMTHDLLRNIITDLDGRVDRIVQSATRDNTSLAVIHLTVRGERVAVDARPRRHRSGSGPGRPSSWKAVIERRDDRLHHGPQIMIGCKVARKP